MNKTSAPIQKCTCFDIMDLGDTMAKKSTLKMKQIWAIKKYSVLLKSEDTFAAIELFLKDNYIEDVDSLNKMIAQALSLKKDVFQMTRAYHAIFDKVQVVAKLDEKVLFLNLLDQLKDVKSSESQIRILLYKLAKRKNASSLLRSDFFDAVKKLV